MDLPVHDQILWHACVTASRRLGQNRIDDPIDYFPLLVRGSWINDTNQVTAFTDRFTNTPAGQPTTPTANVSDAVRTVFGKYWDMQLEGVLERMAGIDAARATRARALVTHAAGAADFGTYQSLDHLDVLDEVVTRELPAFDNANVHAVGATVESGRVFVRRRLAMSTTVDASKVGRLQPESLSMLGRSLHSVADFFAHTNYVELLLWELAVRKKLPEDVIRYFNRDPRARAFDPEFDDGSYTPLPRVPGEWPHERSKPINTVLWYGPTPSQTPLLSCVFDAQDTAYTLLNMYANHLERTRSELRSDQELDLLFSIIDVSGLPIPLKLIRTILDLASTVQDVFEEIGKKARGLLVGFLVDRALARTDDPSAQALLRTSGALLERFDSKEAGEWSRAGRLRFVASTIADDLAARLAKSTPDGAAVLPHHTLLSKDHLPLRPDAQLRYNLACFLATELSASLIEWHFGKEITDPHRFIDFEKNILIHPANGLGQKDRISDAKIAELAIGFLTGSWQMRTSSSSGLVSLRTT